ncbi:DUF1259 domain-containing protein [Bacillus carboniphilus]|uniref:DUF1259 domain-containing protein n=1 Tax=Bacillus carboniphilus TaxID=86663 RepID=A0ABY9JWA3_9BACI|nr:DUF1259 domain-containing protein [Bacillus carboniphilus]WLR42543.1 DUF1259 domain-containing protein [Bacillus carboniphilus]
MKITTRLCEQLSRIIGGEVTNFSNIPQTCNIVNYRDIMVNTLCRENTDPVNNLFWFQSTNIEDQTLNLAFLALLPKEVTSVVNKLSQLNITVTSITQYSLFTTPNIINVYVQSVDNPLLFAEKIRKVLNTLNNVTPQLPVPPPSKSFLALCQEFSRIIGGETDILGDSCEVLRVRNINVKVNGIPTTIGSTKLLGFSFQSLDQNKDALCIGTVALLREEVKLFINSLEREGKFIKSSLFNRWFTHPNLVYLTFVTIENPIVFANQMSFLIKCLK